MSTCGSLEEGSLIFVKVNLYYHQVFFPIVVKGVQSFQPDIHIEGLPKWIVQHSISMNKGSADLLPSVDISCVDEKLVTALLPFQQDGVK